MAEKRTYEQPRSEVAEMVLQHLIAVSGDVTPETPGDNWGWGNETIV